MAEHYEIKKASEMLAMTEKEVFEAIRSGMLPARMENNEWRIPEWGIRAYLRTRKALERIEGRDGADQLEQGALLQAILSRVELILEQSNQEKIMLELIKHNEELTSKIIRLEEELKTREKEMERLKADFLKELTVREEGLRKAFEQERRELEGRIMELEKKLSLRKSRDEVFHEYLLPDQSSTENKGFWRRLSKMLTWD